MDHYCLVPMPHYLWHLVPERCFQNPQGAESQHTFAFKNLNSFKRLLRHCLWFWLFSSILLMEFCFSKVNFNCNRKQEICQRFVSYPHRAKPNAPVTLAFQEQNTRQTTISHQDRILKEDSWSGPSCLPVSKKCVYSSLQRFSFFLRRSVLHASALIWNKLISYVAGTLLNTTNEVRSYIVMFSWQPLLSLLRVPNENIFQNHLKHSIVERILVFKR